MAAAVSRKLDDAVVVGAGHPARVVVQNGGDDARRTVRRGRDDPAAGGVLLVDGERVEGDPVHRCERVAAVLGAQLAGQSRGPALHLQATRQHALGAAAPVVDALLHDLPEVEQAGAHLGLGAPRGLVGHHDAADRQARLGAALEQLVPRGEREADRGLVGDDLVAADLVLVEDEPTPDGVVLALPQGLLALDRRGRLPRREAHAVRMEGQRGPAVQDHVGVDGARHVVAPREPQHPAGADLLEPGVGATGVGRLRLLALEAEHDRLHRSVAVAGGPQRAEQLGLDATDPLEDTVGPQAVGEGVGGPHRSHGVGARRADPDGEQVERADGHERTACLSRRALGDAG